MANKALIESIAKSLVSYGYDVYLSKDGRHGFYTDGQRVVSFGGSYEFFVNFSGNYAQCRHGTGWQLAAEQVGITKAKADEFIKANAPRWTGNTSPKYPTPEEHLRIYGESSGYTKFGA